MKTVENIATVTGLWMVNVNKILRWPSSIINPANSRDGSTNENDRGREGYVVDLSRPEEKFLCRGMLRFMHKVDDDYEGNVQAPASFPRPVINWMIENGYANADARMTTAKARRAATIKAREASADPPPTILPGLATAPSEPPPVPQESTPEESKEAPDGVEGEESAF